MHVKPIPYICDYYDPFDPAFKAGLIPGYDMISNCNGGGLVYRLGQYRHVAIYKPQGSKVRYQVAVATHPGGSYYYSIHQEVLPKILPRILAAVRMDVFSPERI